MATAVQITLILCGTVVLLVVLLMWAARGQSAALPRGERLSLYKRLLAALAEIKSDPSDRGAWQRLSAAAHAIALSAPPDVVSLTVACCRTMHERRLPPDAATARTLLLAFRQDLGLAEVADPSELDFDVVPDAPARNVG